MDGRDSDNMSGFKRGNENSDSEGNKRGHWNSESEASDVEQQPDIAIYRFKVGEFMGKSVRVTKSQPPKPSAIDIIKVITGCDSATAKAKWTYQKKQEWAVGEKFTHWQFSGERQRETPVLTAKQVVKLINALPGAKAAAFRDKCADVFVRYLGGDETLVCEIAANRANAERDPASVNAFAARAIQQGPELDFGVVMQGAGGDLETAVCMFERIMLAKATNSDVMVERERTQRAIAEERERRETLLAQQRLLHDQAREAQSLVKKLDERWYLMAAANRAASAVARKGPCLYFVDDLNGGIMFGYTTRSMTERYKNDKLRSNITENVLLALAAPVLDGTCAARDMERAFKVLVAADAPAFRVVRAERLVDNYDAFSVVSGIWNTRIAPEYGWPVIDLP